MGLQDVRVGQEHVSMGRPHDQQQGEGRGILAGQAPSRVPLGGRQCRQTLDKSDVVVPTAQLSGLIQVGGSSAG